MLGRVWEDVASGLRSLLGLQGLGTSQGLTGYNPAAFVFVDADADADAAADAAAGAVGWP